MRAPSKDPHAQIAVGLERLVILTRVTFRDRDTLRHWLLPHETQEVTIWIGSNDRLGWIGLRAG
jgi:hypothetical protein